MNDQGPDSASIRADGDEASRWPKTIGIISLIYAIGGMLCASVGAAFLGFANAIPEMFRGGVEFPPVIRMVDGAVMVANLGLGVLMLVGAINLLRRRRSGVSLLRKWVIVRLVLLVVAMAAAVVTMEPRVQMLRDGIEFQNDMLRQANRTDRIVEKTDAEMWASARRRSMLMPLVVAVYPVFLGFYLSRRRIDEQIREWD